MHGRTIRGKGGQPMAGRHSWSGGISTATKLAIDGPGDHGWRDRPAGATRM